MAFRLLFFFIFCVSLNAIVSGEILGCGGFIKSHVPIDFSRVEIKLYTKQGILKDRTNCAPNNGYYFVPLYDKGDYILQLEPPAGWSFTPTKVSLSVDGRTDLCSQGKDINFVFKGFGITGKVEALGTKGDGPPDVKVELKSKDNVRNTVTSKNGEFFFTPVYPGEYTVTISHPKWIIKKSSVNVKVTEGNTELPAGSLLIGGYDVTGYIKSNEDPITDLNIVLYQHEDDRNNRVSVEKCEKSLPNGYTGPAGALCYVKSLSGGKFVFPSVSPGKYYVVPFYKSNSIYFEPKRIDFTVTNNAVELSEVFQITGFTLTGKILSSKGGEPLERATIYLNDQQVFVTKKDGVFVLEGVKSGKYTLKVEAEDMSFDVQEIKVNPNNLKLQDISPSAYKVCGAAVSDRPLVVKITKVGTTQQFTIVTEKQTGSFCQYLPIGKYNVQVSLSEQDIQKGLQFFPLSQTIDVLNKPLSGLTFSQVKAKLSGSIVCINSEDCKAIKVILKQVGSEISQEELILTAELKDGKYSYVDVRPGTYEVSLTNTRFCWNFEQQKIVVVNSTYSIPPFIQTGYTVAFVSSHDVKVSYKIPGQEKITYLDIKRDRTTHCIPKAGSYVFNFEGCHIFNPSSVTYNTDNQNNDISILAIKHKHVLEIGSVKDTKPVYIMVTIGSKKTKEGPLKYENGAYSLDLMLAPSEGAILVPQSEMLYFDPPILAYNGKDDCTNAGKIFTGVLGKVFKGQVVPPLAGVEITIESDNAVLTVMTDEAGWYQFAPLDASKNYKISATKDSYVLVGPLENGDFHAHKLAEIVVEVLDEVNNVPLQGALLSLSGGESYRSNLQTDDQGKITFHSLSPSDYFLRPMLKEYHFEPNSKIITVKEGATVHVQLKGKRVAYSAFGTITSLNKEPEDKMIVVASGVNNCSQYSEEATSEINGNYRIRGLLPYCSYEVTVKGGVDETEVIERSAPRSIAAMRVAADIKNLDFIVFRPAATTDVIVKVYAPIVEHYKSLRIKVSRESAPSTLLHTMKVDASHYKITEDQNHGVVMHMPSIPFDGKTYSVQLESTQSHYNMLKPSIQYFTANTSFKAINLEFTVKASAAEQQIKQTSVWTLALIFASLLAAYKADVLIQFAKDRNININLTGIMPNFRNKSPVRDYVIDTNEIDQIVENIKRKTKPRRA